MKLVLAHYDEKTGLDILEDIIEIEDENDKNN